MFVIQSGFRLIEIFLLFYETKYCCSGKTMGASRRCGSKKKTPPQTTAGTAASTRRCATATAAVARTTAITAATLVRFGPVRPGRWRTKARSCCAKQQHATHRAPKQQQSQQSEQQQLQQKQQQQKQRPRGWQSSWNFEYAVWWSVNRKDSQ